ncbi:unnamed protein product [Paramecium pentaurelia]|uniref:Uncharacterized protein n=1 Tax=Paramecium pentaurelia TaxID=43138 RepID=A0A8S1U428_9CILI|nr:unnamed protein product [Paramecium pentaurelia]
MDIRLRQQSAMTYQEYLNYFNKEPDSPKIHPKESPVEPLSDLELSPIQEKQRKKLIVQSCKVIKIYSKL